jgi:chemotaxis protein MotB
VVGLGSSVLFDSGNPRNPINRRISIVVMTKAADAEAKLGDLPMAEPALTSDGAAAPAATSAPLAAAH